MEKLQKENEYLKKRIEFLEMIIEINQETIKKAHDTNHRLLEWIKGNIIP